jgi:uncharacterized protein with NRDE domain
MCLLIAAFRVQPGFPLVVAGNRDEWLARSANPMEVLRPKDPRILGGRDLVAGGTWLATNEHGVCAGLTNQPFPGGGRDLSRRSRGELPLLLASEPTAARAAEVFASQVRAEDYNPCWILFGDRESLFTIDLSAHRPIRVQPLKPGLHVLENYPIEKPSPKSEWVRARLEPPWRDEAEMTRSLIETLRSHEIPEGAAEWSRRQPIPRPVETNAACVHAGPYGTRSATLVVVPEDRAARPKIQFTPGPPCTTSFQNASALWSA